MRLLAIVLTGLWAVTAIVIASAFRPGGAVDIAVALACFVPVAIADIGVVRPPAHLSPRHRTVLIWVWLLAVLLVASVTYGIATTLGGDRPRALVPSLEVAYAGALALFTMAFFSVVGFVHRRLGERPLARRGTVVSVLAAVGLSALAGLAFLFVGYVNERDLRADLPSASRFGPTDPGVEPPFCNDPVALGTNAVVTIEARSSVDGVARGSAVIEGERSALNESWGGSWEGPDGNGQQAYLRDGSRAWLNDTHDDASAPGTSWHESTPDPFDLFGATSLTLDGPPHAVVDAPRGEIIAEDLGLEHIEGARARHCRALIDGNTALETFLPLRWLLYDRSDLAAAIPHWRGEIDWWVFADGELGLATVEVSGSRAETSWDVEGVRAVLEARLEAVDRDQPIDIAAPVAADVRPTATDEARPTDGPRPAATPIPSATPIPAVTPIPSATPPPSPDPRPAVTLESEAP
jgi:hypothetical protein